MLGPTSTSAINTAEGKQKVIITQKKHKGIGKKLPKGQATRILKQNNYNAVSFFPITKSQISVSIKAFRTHIQQNELFRLLLTPI